mmetsp:Transcript_40391/g.129637  ORF Transcript_40391/g.129637 Transcript_40391/m.129637 type:complete len:310 (-) Transcript_40391:734-1663(-)
MPPAAPTRRPRSAAPRHRRLAARHPRGGLLRRRAAGRADPGTRRRTPGLRCRGSTPKTAAVAPDRRCGNRPAPRRMCTRPRLWRRQRAMPSTRRRRAGHLGRRPRLPRRRPRRGAWAARACSARRPRSRPNHPRGPPEPPALRPVLQQQEIHPARGRRAAGPTSWPPGAATWGADSRATARQARWSLQEAMGSALGSVRRTTTSPKGRAVAEHHQRAPAAAPNPHCRCECPRELECPGRGRKRSQPRRPLEPRKSHPHHRALQQQQHHGARRCRHQDARLPPKRPGSRPTARRSESPPGGPSASAEARQ